MNRDKIAAIKHSKWTQWKEGLVKPYLMQTPVCRLSGMIS